jgi:RNA polymerase sigma factor (sigma-70 family)
MTAGMGMTEPAGKGEFEGFYACQLPRLLRYCAMLGLSWHAAQDVAQEAFVQVLSRWAAITDPAAYLRTTAYHLAIKRPAEEPASASADRHPASQMLPELPGFEERHAILRACRELPSQQQAVFALHYDGYRDQEIARILGMKPITVRSHLRHARENLRAWWDRESGDNPGGERAGR